jgi:hypothetical protein
MPTLREIELTLRARIKEIDREISNLRCEQKGLEKALSITLGQCELVKDYVCDPLGRAILTVNKGGVSDKKKTK